MKRFITASLFALLSATGAYATTYTVVAPTTSPGTAAQPALGNTFYNPGNLPTLLGQGDAFSGGSFWVSNDHPTTLLDFGQLFRSISLEFQDAFDQKGSFFRVNGQSLIAQRQQSGDLNTFQFENVSSLLFQTAPNDGFAFRVTESIPSSVPLPAGILLMLSALGFTGFFRKK